MCVSVIPVCPIIQIMSLEKEAFREDYPAKESRTKDLQPFFSCIITKVCCSSRRSFFYLQKKQMYSVYAWMAIDANWLDQCCNIRISFPMLPR